MGPDRYRPPDLNRHEVHYKGKRFWIFEISEECPFQGYEGPYAQIIVYDKTYGIAVACAKKLDRGFSGVLTCTIDRVEVKGSSLQSLLINSIKLMRFYEKHASGHISPRTSRPYLSRKIG
jgi:hypothetical protein